MKQNSYNPFNIIFKNKFDATFIIGTLYQIEYIEQLTSGFKQSLSAIFKITFVKKGQRIFN